MTAVLEPCPERLVAGTVPDRFHVVIAGAGPAGVEAALRLRRIAGREVRITVVAPDPRFLALPPATAAPFGLARSPRARLQDRLAPALLVRGTVAFVADVEQQVRLDDGRAIGYDALLVAVGGRRRPPFRRVLAYGTPGSEERMHGLIQDVEAGYVRRIAFVVPSGAAWPLPLYELALLTAERAYDMCAGVELTLLTPERRVLEILGAAVSDEVATALDAAGIAVRTGTGVALPTPRSVALEPSGECLAVDRVVTLPVLDGPRLAGLPHDEAGFLPADRFGRVLGAPGVYVAGDATAGSIKQGGLACQQADTAVATIVADAGLGSDPRPSTPTLRGVVLTARGARRFERELDGDSDEPSERPWTKFAGRELSRLLLDERPRR